jgi:hypothetical protein
VRSGAASDGIEPERLPPGQDIVAVQASYDTATGTIIAAVTTRGAPEPLATRGLRTDFFPVDAAGECVAPEARLASIYSEAGAFWVYDGSSLQAGQKSVAGNTTTLNATSPLLVNQPFFCVDAYVLTESGEVLEALLSPFKLLAPATPPPPPPPSSPPPRTHRDRRRGEARAGQGEGRRGQTQIGPAEAEGDRSGQVEDRLLQAAADQEGEGERDDLPHPDRGQGRENRPAR